MLDVFSEEGDERLSEGVTEHELGADDEDLNTLNRISTRQPLIKRGKERTFGVKPLNSAETPSFLTNSLITVTPLTFCSKFAFWMRVLTTSSGAATVMEATAPEMEAMKFWVQVALE